MPCYPHLSHRSCNLFCWGLGTCQFFKGEIVKLSHSLKINTAKLNPLLGGAHNSCCAGYLVKYLSQNAYHLRTGRSCTLESLILKTTQQPSAQQHGNHTTLSCEQRHFGLLNMPILQEEVVPGLLRRKTQ